MYAKNSEGRFAPTGTVISRPDLGTFGTAMSVTADFMMFGDYCKCLYLSILSVLMLF